MRFRARGAERRVNSLVWVSRSGLWLGAPPHAWRNGTTVRTHAIRSAKVASRRCSTSPSQLGLARTRNGAARQWKGAAALSTRGAAPGRCDDAAGPTDSTAPSTRQGLRVVLVS
eukprot:scaffold17636_cov31-Phaeocystis_antarctica.AAC.1